MSSKVGRKSKYDTNVKPKFDLIRQMSLDGATNHEIARALGISSTAFCKYQNLYPDFFDLINEGRLKGVTEVKNALYRKAIGFEYEEKKTYIKRDTDGREYKYTEITKRQSLPDINAIAMYLRNYDRTWSDNDYLTNEFRRMEVELKQSLADKDNF